MSVSVTRSRITPLRDSCLPMWSGEALSTSRTWPPASRAAFAAFTSHASAQTPIPTPAAPCRHERLCGARTFAVSEDLVGVSGKVPDDTVDLGNRDLDDARHPASLPSADEPQRSGRLNRFHNRQPSAPPRTGSIEGRHAFGQGY